MSTPDELTRGVKTLGIKLKPDVHAQLSFIAQLREGTITDEIQIAIAEHITRSRNDPELAQQGSRSPRRNRARSCSPPAGHRHPVRRRRRTQRSPATPDHEGRRKPIGHLTVPDTEHGRP